ncbi:MFS transporter [Agilicoccus flavus]|uniref:MFS transporter n=1 Tax=Agilicoccus flavus TaxID=2775968 RepID=UPI001CF65B86|nr:MFS transporter [Agilicoccus flavus]
MRLVARLPAPLALLLFTQFAFNVGFYLVVPFLAAYLGHTLQLAGWVVGAVLGVRTFSQQGLFVVGGALADRFGIRASIVVGCGIRIAGFVTLGLSASLPGVVTGVVLIGLAAALFSPATEAAIVAWGGEVERGGGPTLREIVAAEAVCSKLGSVVGPVLGAALVVVPFRVSCLVAAALFAVILLAQVAWLPPGSRIGEPRPVAASFRLVLANRPFLAFAALHSTYLLSYNQLYLAAPVELDRVGGPAAGISWVFVAAALLVVAAQVPVTRVALRFGRVAALRCGYALIAGGFLAVAVAAPLPPAPGAWAYGPLAVFVTLLHVGGILVLPAARAVVADLSAGHSLGTYLGFLASAGGLAVLLGSTVAGRLLDDAASPGPLASLAWLFLAALPAAAALGIGPFGGRHLPAETRPAAPGESGQVR